MRILVEGWRFVPHSYATINHFQLLELSKRRDIELFHTDAPYLKPWQSIVGLFDPETEATLRNIRQPQALEPIDIKLRMFFPANLKDSTATRTFVFSTTEWGHVIAQDLLLMGVKSFEQAHADSNAVIITSSQWSRDGFLRSGADPDRVVIVPHGVDLDIYKPLSDEEKNDLRCELGWENDFIFLNVGNPTRNKGLPFLFKAFATVSERYPNARLVLKGVNALFPGKDFTAELKKIIGNILTNAEIARIEDRFSYIGEAMSFAEMARLYQAADAYVSPYIAEGFNMPVLEAIACGLPIICTKGGSTDDFTNASFAWRIDSKLEVDTEYEEKPLRLIPNIEHLIALMTEIIDAPSFISQSLERGPAFVEQNYTWKHIVDRLLNLFQTTDRILNPNVNSQPNPNIDIDTDIDTFLSIELENAIVLTGDRTADSIAYIMRAQQLQQQEQLDAAIAHYQKAIALQPDAVNAYWALGDILYKQNKQTEAYLCKYHALVIAPQRFNVDMHLSLANTLVQRNCWEEAANIYRNLLHFAPERVEAYFNLGGVLSKQGKLDEAINRFRAFANLVPDNAQVHYSLGNTFKKQGNLESAIASYRDAIARQPNYIEAIYNLANSLVACQQIDEAILYYERAIACQPNFSQAQFNLAVILMERGDLDPAAAYFQQILAVQPNYIECYWRLATIFQHQTKLPAAIKSLQQALQIQPGYAAAHYQLYNLLSVQDLAASRQAAESFVHFCSDRERILPAICLIASYLKSGLHQEATTKFLELEQYVYSHYQNLTEVELEALYVKILYFLPFMRDDRAANASFSRLISQQYLRQISPKGETISGEVNQGDRRDRNADLRIGFISMHLKRHPIGWCAYDFMRELSDITPHLYIYTTRQFTEDDRTQKFTQITDHFYRTTQLEPKAIAREIKQRIIADQIDVLVDLDSIMNLVHAEILRDRPAPVCITWPSFDAPFVSSHNYEICDRYTHPAGVESHYLEQLVRVPDSHMAVGGFETIAIDREAIRQQYGIQSEQVAYLFSAPAHKLSIESLQAQISILQRVPSSVLIHKGIGDLEIIEALYRRESSVKNVNFDRMLFLPRSSTEEEHRATYLIADVSLDSYPYNGGTHNVEAFWCNLPLVTRVGDQSFARMGLSFLNTLGITAGMANSWEEYVEWGVRFGLDSNLRQSVREQLEQSKQQSERGDRRSPLWNPKKYATDLYAILSELRQRG
jgi:predicted O-linked N-acetylglucosamine transferase (SPINDLY family)/glycosyltransferase involved in cell wall biosynthesis